MKGKLIGFTLAFALVLGLSLPAAARNTMHDLSVKAAVESERGKEKLLGVKYYMAGQRHAKAARDLGTFTANRRTNAFNKSDEFACQIAFLSALIALQKRAQSLGADAVVDIKSMSRHGELVSASQFRCAAGNVVANVVLSGRMVTFKGR
ncbi:MAG: excinuclease ABC subunit A [Proteobacteria bacterium]|nr:excinuclease ABC subunit A [Pseudomonadota bacterium]